MKCGPDGCPIVAFSDLTPAEQRVERKRIAKRMYDQGFTMEQIAKQFGVTNQTISNDLREFPNDLETKPRPSKRGRKGEGRPKSSKNKSTESKTVRSNQKKPGVKQAQRSIDVAPEDWVAFKAKAKAEGKSVAEKLGELVQEPEITRDMLSMTAQQKFDVAVRQERRRLEIAVRQELHAEYQKWLADLIADYRKKEKHYNIIIKQHKGIMDKATYNLIWSCLHADSRKSVSDEKLNRAFNLWANLEKAVLSEKDSPNKFSDLPQTVEELLKRGAEYQARRAAERAARKTGKAMT